MKHYRTTILLAGILLMMPVLTQSQAPSGSTHYMTIVAKMDRAGLLTTGSIYISQNGETYERKTLKTKATEGYYDFNPVIRIIQKHTREGWKVITSNISGDSKNGPEQTLYILMQRTKPYRINPNPIDTLINEQGQQQEVFPMEII
jgi:hypothetical protein